MTEGKAVKKTLFPLSGQRTEESTQAIMVQRKLKNNTKALQKLQTKIKKMNPTSEEFQSAKQEEAVLLGTVKELSERFNVLTNGALGYPSSRMEDNKSGGGEEEGGKAEQPVVRSGGEVENHQNKKANEKRENLSNAAGVNPLASSSGPRAALTGSGLGGGEENTGKKKEMEKSQRKAVDEETEEDREKAKRDLQRLEDMVIQMLNESEPCGESGNTSFLPVYRASSYLANATMFIHPQVAEATLLMEELIIVGCNARTMTMIAAFKQLLRSIMKSDANASTKQVGSGVGGGSTRTGASRGGVNEKKGGRMNEDGTTLMLNRETVLQLLDANFNFMRRTRIATSGMNYVKQTLKKRAVLAGEGSSSIPRSGQAPTSPYSVSSAFSLEDASSRKGEVLEMDHIMSSSLPPPSSFTATLSTPRATDTPAERSLLGILQSIEMEIHASHTTIVEERGNKFISPHDTILVFGRSSVVEDVLLHAAKTKYFKVIIIDAAPLYEGQKLLAQLSTANISVTYGLLTSCCTLMPKATRVFIGAASVLQNGDVFSRCGTALVAVCAKSFRRPVLCFSESYKFVAEVWLGNSGQNDLVQTAAFPLSVPTATPYCGSGGGRMSAARGEGIEGGGLGGGHPLGSSGRKSGHHRVVLVRGEGVQGVGSSSGGGAASPGHWSPWDAPDRFSPMTSSSPLSISTSSGTATAGPSGGMPSSPLTASVSAFSSSSRLKAGVPMTGRGGSGGAGGSYEPPGVSSPFSPSSRTVSRGYLYDLTPATCVDLIISEIDCLHSSAIMEAIKDREMRDKFH